MTNDLNNSHRIDELEKRIKLLETNLELLVEYLKNPVDSQNLKINAVGVLIKQRS